jgi:hypothetical protein
LQAFEPLSLNVKFVGQLVNTDGRIGLQQGRRDLQCQRQPTADPGQSASSLQVAADPPVIRASGAQCCIQERRPCSFVQDRHIQQPRP